MTEKAILRKINIMLQHRGSIVSPHSGMQMAKTPARVFEVNSLTHTVTSDDPVPTNTLLFLATTSLGKSDINNIVTFASTVQHIIIYGHVSLQAKSQLLSAAAFCEVITQADIVFDKCANVLVPTYRIIEPVEALQIAKARNTTIQQFPKMKSSDAMARYLGFKPGTVVHALETDTMRLVV
jgi:DNA-directed RNA polymerase subunit H (RpoH/RPB5)